jgi:AraC-like DNA-binding protein
MKIIHAHPQESFLSAFVESYFFIEDFQERIGLAIPNGRLDVSIVLEGQIQWYDKEKEGYEVLPAVTVYPLTQTGSLFKTTADIRCISIKLFPHVMALPFFKNKAFKKPCSLSNFFPDADTAGLVASLRNIALTKKMTAMLDTFFKAQFYNASTNLWMQQITQIIESDSEHIINVQNLANCLGVNIKTLERKFIQTTGLTPKQFARIIQLQQAVSKIKNTNPERFHGEFTELLNSSYSDQSHFIKACKKITGLTPKQFFAGLPERMTDLVIYHE